MTARMDLTLDCANPARLAAFWKLALGYEDEPPPAPFTTREEWLQQYGDPGDHAEDGARLHDPAGTGPRLSLLRVPEAKVAKNRLHLDIRVAGTGSGDERWARIRQAADRLTAAGATSLREYPGTHIVMADPEGNEFCVG
jgi:catechol 2,3-dioxygenase-like lactoylglutathione lyase family enzyme